MYTNFYPLAFCFFLKQYVHILYSPILYFLIINLIIELFVVLFSFYFLIKSARGRLTPIPPNKEKKFIRLYVKKDSNILSCPGLCTFLQSYKNLESNSCLWHILNSFVRHSILYER